jgi:hypothetical protein
MPNNSGLCGDLYQDEEGFFQTCDLYLASFLLAAGAHMSRHERDQRSKRVYFVFEKNPLLQDLKVNYFARSAKVDALTFADNIKSLKSLCHNIAGGPRE